VCVDILLKTIIKFHHFFSAATTPHTQTKALYFYVPVKIVGHLGSYFGFPEIADEFLAFKIQVEFARFPFRELPGEDNRTGPTKFVGKAIRG
jgi:hypothetical protein